MLPMNKVNNNKILDILKKNINTKKNNEQLNIKIPINNFNNSVIKVNTNIKEYNDINIKFNENTILFFNPNNNILINKLTMLDLNNHFLNPNENNNKKEIINYLIGTFEYNKNTNLIDFKLNNHLKSPLMKNIDVLIKINNYYNELENNDFYLNIPNIEKNFLKLNLRRIIYAFLKKTLELINLISKKLYEKRNPEDELKKKLLLNYTISTVYRISKYVDNHFIYFNKKIDSIQKKQAEVDEIRYVLSEKIDKLNKNIEKQNEYITKFYDKIKNKY
jgi:hypothetical protein